MCMRGQDVAVADELSNDGKSCFRRDRTYGHEREIVTAVLLQHKALVYPLRLFPVTDVPSLKRRLVLASRAFSGRCGPAPE